MSQVGFSQIYRSVAFETLTIIKILSGLLLRKKEGTQCIHIALTFIFTSIHIAVTFIFTSIHIGGKRK